ncbi:hypothetical protein [Thermoflexus sp.]|uniref:hypothetical protein n=1 Tax=Thermoflexus sp. TaxID=1969742 RepID=UPI0017612137|nr:hypothetical protein [Thermoflexus sp.]
MGPETFRKIDPHLRRGRNGILISLLAISLSASQPFLSFEDRLSLHVAGRGFHFATWLLSVWWEKLILDTATPQAFLDEATQGRTLRGFLRHLEAAQQAAADLEHRMAGSEPTDPAILEDLRRRWETEHRKQEALRPLVEGILAEQLAVLLRGEGLTLLGYPIPPVNLRLTAMPNLLVVSPRDRIVQRAALPLQADLTADEMERIERHVDGAFNVSSLVVPLGGLALYPAMILEIPSLPYLTETIAHEWTHHWLFLWPLGWFYERPEARTINETAADLVGKALGRAWLARFYPEDLPSPPSPADSPHAPEEQPAFHFGRELAKTRTVVERLLARGEIRRAEQYMEARRRVFLEHGYVIRKLNQAYFAFYGAYAAEEGAAGVEDPIGPRVRRLWEQSPSLRAFLFRIAFITDLAGLRRALGEP